MKKVAGYIERKSMLYKTGVEYGDYTMNHVLGCSHGCKYPCYAFALKKRFGQVHTYEQWTKPYLVSNTIALLDQEIPRLKEKIESVELCFTTDPFMYEYNEIAEMSIAAISRLNDADIRCSVLTKGILPISLAEYSPKNEYGITLVSLDEDFQKKMEPYAAPCAGRLAALRALHDKGCNTWVSIEPYPTPNMIDQNLYEILESVAFVNKIIFGRLHYNKVVSAYPGYKKFYNNCASEVIQFCEEHKIAFHIKKGTNVD